MYGFDYTIASDEQSLSKVSFMLKMKSQVYWVFTP
jgi:hypothetical protein